MFKEILLNESQKPEKIIKIGREIQNQIERFSKILSVTIIASVAAIFLVGFLRGNNIITMFLTSVGLAVSAIPEGLLVAVTITLSIGISQMAKHNAVVKKLSAVETLGSTNVICTDKTGTLTKNQMTVTRLWVGCEEYSVTGSGYGKDGKVFFKKDNQAVVYNNNLSLKLTSLLSLTCTESTISEEDGIWKLDITPYRLKIAKNSKKTISKKLSAIRSFVKYIEDYHDMPIKLISADSIKIPQNLPKPIEQKPVIPEEQTTLPQKGKKEESDEVW